MNAKKGLLILALVALILISGCTGKDTTPPTGKTTEENQPSSAQTTTKITTPSVSKSSSPTTVILEPISAETGSIGSPSGSYIGVVGDLDNGRSVQGFLSFNIKSIPENATITEAILDYSHFARSGDPFSSLGCMGAYEQNFGAVDTTDFFYAKPTGALSKWCSYGDLSEPSSSQELMSALQSKLGQSRFQIRLQFDKSTDDNKQSDNLYGEEKKLRVTYTKT